MGGKSTEGNREEEDVELGDEMTNLEFWDLPFYPHLQENIGFKRVNPSLSTGKDFLIHPQGRTLMEKHLF